MVNLSLQNRRCSQTMDTVVMSVVYIREELAVNTSSLTVYTMIRACNLPTSPLGEQTVNTMSDSLTLNVPYEVCSTTHQTLVLSRWGTAHQVQCASCTVILYMAIT